MQDGESSALFDDRLFGQSQEWKLSTSGLSAGLQFRGTGYAFRTFIRFSLINYLTIALGLHSSMDMELIVSFNPIEMVSLSIIAVLLL